MLDKGFIIDGIKWVIGQHPPKAIPLCPIDYIELDPYPLEYVEYATDKLVCEKCGKKFKLPRSIVYEKQYVLRIVNSKVYKAKKYINVDDEAIPLAEKKESTKDGKYFITSLLTESKTGKRLIVYAGEKGKQQKTQIFVEPDIKRLAFDQNDLHPIDVFTKVEATFADGTKAGQEKRE